MRALTDYVKQYSDSIPPETVRTFCKSYAADVGVPVVSLCDHPYRFRASAKAFTLA